MRKLLLSVISVAILASSSLAVYNYFQLHDEQLSETTLENIEALTDDPEGGGDGVGVVHKTTIDLGNGVTKIEIICSGRGSLSCS